MICHIADQEVPFSEIMTKSPLPTYKCIEMLAEVYSRKSPRVEWVVVTQGEIPQLITAKKSRMTYQDHLVVEAKSARQTHPWVLTFV